MPSINKQQLFTLALASAIGGLIVVWLTPMFKRLPPKER